MVTYHREQYSSSVICYKSKVLDLSNLEKIIQFFIHLLQSKVLVYGNLHTVENSTVPHLFVTKVRCWTLVTYVESSSDLHSFVTK